MISALSGHHVFLMLVLVKLHCIKCNIIYIYYIFVCNDVSILIARLFDNWLKKVLLIQACQFAQNAFCALEKALPLLVRRGVPDDLRAEAWGMQGSSPFVTT